MQNYALTTYSKRGGACEESNLQNLNDKQNLNKEVFPICHVIVNQADSKKSDAIPVIRHPINSICVHMATSLVLPSSLLSSA